MRSFLLFCLLSGGLWLAACGPGFAQTAAALDSVVFERNMSANKAMPDLSVPESPAFTLLGVTPANVTRPGTPRAFAASLLDAVDKNGKLQNGLAVDVAPLLNGTSLADYRQRYLKRFLANTQLSLATTRSREGDAATQTGLGLHLTLLNGSDPRLDNGVLEVTRAIRDSLRQAMHIMPDSSPADLENFDKVLGDLLKSASATARFKRRLAALSSPAKTKSRERNNVWTLAAALSNRSELSTIRGLRYNGWGIWSSYSLGLGRAGAGQFILHGRLRFDERTTDASGTAVIVNYYHLVGGRFRTSIGAVKASLEGAFTSTKTTTAVDTPPQVTYAAGGVFSAILEARLSPNLWLHAALYSEAFKNDGNNVFGFKAAIKWAAQP